MSIQVSDRNGTRCSMQKTLRRRTRVRIWCFCCLIALVFLPPRGSAKDPDKFKPFKLKTLDGTKKTLQDYANKAILVSFFYPNCPYCSVALPEVQKIYDKYKDKGLSVVWINVLPQENRGRHRDACNLGD